MERPGPLALTAKGLVIAAIAVVVLYPFVVVLSTSLATQADISRAGGVVFLPSHLDFGAYKEIFQGGAVTRALAISVGVTVIGTACSMSATIGMAYGLSRRGVTGGRFILFVALFSMLFTPGIIPSFLVVKQLGLLNNFASLVLPTLVSAFNLVVLRSFFMSLPKDLFEAATLDGCGDFGLLFRIVLPLSKGVLAVVGLFYAVGYWNAFFNAMLYMDSSNWPLSMILRQFVILGLPAAGGAQSLGAELAPSEAVQNAVVIIALVPLLLVYPFLQRYFTKGVLSGAIKG